MKLKYKFINLPFKDVFTTSKGSKTHQPSLLVELEHFGIKGYGEAPIISYYDLSVEKMEADILRKKLFIEKFSFTEPDRYWHYLHHLFPQNPFLVAALDIAAWDIYGKMKGRQLHQLWNLDTQKNPMTDFTIGIDSVEKMIEKIEANPWPIYKIKLGTADDIEIIQELRKRTNSILRIDANAAWGLDLAIQNIKILHELDIELVEQPLAKDAWEEMKILKEQSPIPLFADESCVSEEDVEKCNGFFDGINIKLTKCSGLTPALRMIQNARELGLKVMLGSMNESSVGTSAMAQLLPICDYADIDGPLLLAEDVADGITYENGKIIYTNLPGLGISIDAF